MGIAPVSHLRHPADVWQRSSHKGLVCDSSRVAAPPASRSGRIDAIVVPSARGTAALQGVIRLSTTLNVPLVVLCSKETVGVEVAARIAAAPGCAALIIDVPADYRHGLIPTRTSAAGFRRANAHRRSDLGLKRNLGLLLARLQGWGKILFLDDDIGEPVHGAPVSLPVRTVHRLAATLETHQVAGLSCQEFPDNSVVCHARRLAGLPQDTFISGAALGVNCNDQPLPFFPDLYNEDWFFFSPLAAGREIAHAGYATQAAYDPFEKPSRARDEEFGDLLAEGLYALFEDQPVEMNYFRRLGAADANYWEKFIAARQENLHVINRELHQQLYVDTDQQAAAIRSLRNAVDQLGSLSPELCVNFLDAWATDLTSWERAAQRVCDVGSTAEALDFLGLQQWDAIRFTSRDRGGRQLVTAGS